ncbi:hypothetical protein GCM10009117_12630 [Gangjinia marincola]|uniref:HD/PDEase domain-containing protein n=1 Tax=Gangjinia marincola TaxID=578463 RepID=A0ABP3XRW3_9FLAO
MTEVTAKAEKFVINLLKSDLPNTVIYHNYTHTQRVLKSTNEIVDNTSLTDIEKLILRLTAIFHDVGYIQGHENHEERSAKIAEEYLQEHDVPQHIIDETKRCILATKMTHTPSDKLEEIIRDADASHFAKEYFKEASEYLRQELKLLGIETYTPEEWTKKNIQFFTNEHEYYSDYALKNWKKLKDENLSKLFKKERKFKKRKKKEKLKAKYKDESPQRGVQTLFRVTLRNHIKLSDIADTKANILLSVNAIIISLALSNLIPKLDNPSNAHLVIPTLIFVVFSTAAMVLSVLATRPNVTSGTFDKEDVKKKKVNLLFFGNFHKMELKDFEWAIENMLEDKEYIYSTMTKDLYFLGKVLHKKYTLLRITYTVFMVGIILSVIAFAIAYKFKPSIDF